MCIPDATTNFTIELIIELIRQSRSAKSAEALRWVHTEKSSYTGYLYTLLWLL